MQKHDKIYVAGHNGMLGSAIYRQLQTEGFENIIVASRKELDLQNENLVEQFFEKEKPKYVFMAAAKVGGIQANMKSPYEFLLENVKIQNNIINSCFKFNVDKLCFIGSSCIYPTNCPQPIKEEYLLSGPLEMTNEAYAIAKIAGIKLGQYLNSQYGLKVINPMPCNLYGPNDSFHPQNSHVISALVKKFTDACDNNLESVELWGTGIARREFMHVSDAANAIIFLMKQYHSAEIINIGEGIDISIKDLAEKIATYTGFKGNLNWDELKPNGMLRKCLDVSKMNSLGFKPKINLDKGIKEMIINYKKEKSKV